MIDLLTCDRLIADDTISQYLKLHRPLSRCCCTSREGDMRKLFWKDLQRLHRYQRYPIVVNHIKQQYQYLKCHRVKRYDIISAYEKCIQSSSNSETNVDEWIKISYQHINYAHELFVADGIKWNRQLTNNLNLAVTDICRETIFTQLLLDTLSDNQIESNDIKMNQFCRHVVEDIDALTKEKFGACPQVYVEGDFTLHNHRLPLIQFCLVEFLKNSILAVIKKYGVLELDDASPIIVRLESDPNQLILVDTGIGIDANDLQNCFQAFYTTTPINSNPTYQYSRDFGVPYSGAGFGMLKSQVIKIFFSSHMFIL